MSSRAEQMSTGCLPVGHTAGHPRFRQVSQGIWYRRRQGWELEWASELAMPITLRSHLSFSLDRVDVQRKRVGKRETG